MGGERNDFPQMEETTGLVGTGPCGQKSRVERTGPYETHPWFNFWEFRNVVPAELQTCREPVWSRREQAAFWDLDANAEQPVFY